MDADSGCFARAQRSNRSNVPLGPCGREDVVADGPSKLDKHGIVQETGRILLGHATVISQRVVEWESAGFVVSLSLVCHKEKKREKVSLVLSQFEFEFHE